MKRAAFIAWFTEQVGTKEMEEILLEQPSWADTVVELMGDNKPITDQQVAEYAAHLADFLCEED